MQASKGDVGGCMVCTDMVKDGENKHNQYKAHSMDPFICVSVISIHDRLRHPRCNTIYHG